MMRIGIFQLLALSLFFISSFPAAVMAQDSTGLTRSAAEVAAESYRAGDFGKSAEQYEAIVSEALAQGRESAALYYNLGNAYFRDNQLAKAILNYERALLLDPGDGDIRHNLRFAQNRTEDRIEQAATFFLQNWFKRLRDLNHANRWAMISILFFLLFLACVALFLFARLLWIRKSAFYSGLLLLFLVIATNLFAFSQKRERTYRDGGIVMVGAAEVKASPDMNSNRLFELHEGTRVRIRNSDGNWYEVEIANGSVGWTEKKNVEII